MIANEHVRSAEQALRQAHAARDLTAVLRIHDSTLAGALPPRRTLDAATDRTVVRSWFEAWDDVLLGWWLADDEPSGLWQRLLVPRPEGFALPLLLMNAWWLRESGSSRVKGPPPLPSPAVLAALPLAAQARALGRHLVRCDGGTAFDYEAIAAVVRAELRPVLAQWLLSVYVMSPMANTRPEWQDNRRRAIDGFCAVHERTQVPVPAMLLLGTAPFRASFYAEDAGRFAAAVATSIVAPAFRAAIGRTVPVPGGGGTGILLSCWNEQHAVQRCIDPLLDRVREKGITAFWLDGTADQAPQRLPAAWLGGRVSLRSKPIRPLIQDLCAAAGEVAKARLDVLIYPEVGITLASRWLSTQRLARVQAATYGHPVSTGSQVIDYFIGGRAVESDGTAYSERLVLLPGLGVASTVPPAPSAPRRRSFGEERLLAVNVSSFDKLNAALLSAWNAVLSGGGMELVMLPGVAAVRAEAVASELGRHLTAGPVSMQVDVPRQRVVDLLAEADLYLDSFPFGDYNTLVEALACGCPVVTLEGRSACGRFGAAMLRMLGLPERLITKTPEEYVAAARALVRDPALRLDVRAMLSRERVIEVLCRTDMDEHFAAAVQWMREQGPRRPGPPVLVEAGERPKLLAA